jgi:hypothetical protein
MVAVPVIPKGSTVRSTEVDAKRATYTCRHCGLLAQLEHVVHYMGQSHAYYDEEVWKCNRHAAPVRYVVFPPYPELGGEEVWAECLSVTLNDTRYSVQIHFPDQICVIYHVTVEGNSFNQEELVRFPWAGEITPSNVRQKLPIILTFL